MILWQSRQMSVSESSGSSEPQILQKRVMVSSFCVMGFLCGMPIDSDPGKVDGHPWEMKWNAWGVRPF